MIYDSSNARGAPVFDVDTKERLNRVLAINPSAGWVLVVDEPLRVTAHDQVASKRIRFRSIHAIRGLEREPSLFHCYGRLHRGADSVPTPGFALLQHGEAIIPAGIKGWGLGRKEGDGYAIGGGSSH